MARSAGAVTVELDLAARPGGFFDRAVPGPATETVPDRVEELVADRP